MAVNLRTRFYSAFDKQLISIETDAGHLDFMLSRKQTDELIKLLQEEKEGVIA